MKFSVVAFLLVCIFTILSGHALRGEGLITTGQSNQMWQISNDGSQAVYVGEQNTGSFSLVLNKALLANQTISIEVKSDAKSYTFNSGDIDCALDAQSSDDKFTFTPGGSLSLPNAQLNGFNFETGAMSNWVALLQQGDVKTLTLTFNKATYAKVQVAVETASASNPEPAPSPTLSSGLMTLEDFSNTNTLPGSSAPNIPTITHAISKPPNQPVVPSIPSYLIDNASGTSDNQGWNISAVGSEAVYQGDADKNGAAGLVLQKSSLLDRPVQITINSNAGAYTLRSGNTSITFDSESTNDVITLDPGGPSSTPDLELNGRELTGQRGQWAALLNRESDPKLAIVLHSATYATVSVALASPNAPKPGQNANAPDEYTSPDYSGDQFTEYSPAYRAPPQGQVPSVAMKQNMPVYDFMGDASLLDQHVKSIIPAHDVTVRVETGTSPLPQAFEDSFTGAGLQAYQMNLAGGVSVQYPDFANVTYTVPDETIYGDPVVVCKSMVNLLKEISVTNINSYDSFNLLLAGEEHLINAIENLDPDQLNAIDKYERIILLNSNIPAKTPIIGTGQYSSVITDKKGHVTGIVIIPDGLTTPVLITNPVVADKGVYGSVVFGGLYAGEYTDRSEGKPSGWHP